MNRRAAVLPAWARRTSRQWSDFVPTIKNTKARPGRPEGGEAMGLRAVYLYLRGRLMG